ncbi:MAG TPA: endonuclease/exonuclease/phosphatase family protein, partial [Marinagarivorans sp.]|nr:endonuclease/exonuclease/phosphatase family protein [Marinagarivorans sp.]
MYQLIGAAVALAALIVIWILKPPVWAQARQNQQHPSITFATWNLEWLVRLEDYPRLLAQCDANGQPDSAQWRFPCASEHPLPPARTPADIAALAQIAEGLAGAVVALQEVDGPMAAAQVFPAAAWHLDCFAQRNHPQKLGFALPKNIPYACGPELASLDIDGKTRSGVVVTLWPHTPQAVRILNVHLKSGCFAGPLYKKGPCLALRSQVPVVEAWIDQQVAQGQAFVVLGDFNRRLEKDAQYPAGPDEQAPTSMFAAWSDQRPAGAELLRATALMADAPCSPLSPYTQGAIDNILVSALWAGQFKRQEARRITYSAEQAKRYALSDHC